MRTDRLRAEYQIEFRYTLFPLHPDTPDEGLSLEQLFAGRSFDIDAMQARLATLMAEEGLPFSQRTMTYNSRLAQELAKWAETQSGGAGIHDALYRAYFVDGLNIALIDNLMTVVRQLGLPEDEARDVLAVAAIPGGSRCGLAAVQEVGCHRRTDIRRRQQGVVGAQPYEVLERLIVAGGAVKR